VVELGCIVLELVAVVFVFVFVVEVVVVVVVRQLSLFAVSLRCSEQSLDRSIRLL
jgi:hypothetical protein